ncbi:MAG: tetratricopeptide repeat protein [Acidimicrobiia bacterium]|nr:tetratricopeptide repeat protein [Acidimicrobiia bacterium]
MNTSTGERRASASPSPKLRRLAAVLVVALAAGLMILGAGPVQHPSSARSIAESEIDFFSHRVAENPRDVVSATRLAQALRQHQRETSDIASLAEADEILSAAIRAIPGYLPARLAHAQVLIDLHRFEEGLALATAVVESGGDSSAQLTVGDALLALGEYDLAEATFRAVKLTSDSPAVDARLARLAELRGDRAAAIAIMEDAFALVVTEARGGEQVAWFATRLGNLYLDDGQTDPALERFESALFALPDYAPALTGLGDVGVARGDIDGAITWYERATSVATDPDWYFTLAELHRLAGNLEAGATYTELAVGTVATFGEIHPRDFALHYASLDNPTAMSFAQKGLDRTDDIYAHDTMAWVLYHAGNYELAQSHSRIALSLGTKDAELIYHLGAILLALGDTAGGTALILEAVNIGLDPWVEAEAAELLADAEN